MQSRWVGKSVYIEWKDPDLDWNYFTVLSTDPINGLLRLRGEDDPTTGIPHQHDEFITDQNEIHFMKTINTRTRLAEVAQRSAHHSERYERERAELKQEWFAAIQEEVGKGDVAVEVSFYNDNGTLTSETKTLWLTGGSKKDLKRWWKGLPGLEHLRERESLALPCGEAVILPSLDADLVIANLEEELVGAPLWRLIISNDDTLCFLESPKGKRLYYQSPETLESLAGLAELADEYALAG